MPNPLSSLIPTLAALAAVLGIILLAGQIVRRTGLGRQLAPIRAEGGPRLMVLDTLTLDRARRLHVIRWEGRDLVLLTGGPADQVVGWVPPGDRA
jgi:flagellar protein FliO/FliZ